MVYLFNDGNIYGLKVRISIQIVQQIGLIILSRMRPDKVNDLTPWQHRQEQEIDRIPMPTNTNFKQDRISLVSVSAVDLNQSQSPLQPHPIAREGSFSPRRQLSYRQRQEQPRRRMHMKRVEVSSIMGIGKGMEGEIATAKKKIQNKMIEHLLLVYLAEELRQQVVMAKNEMVKQKYQCLFPLIGIAGASKEMYRNRGSLNDLIDFKHI